MSVFFVSGIDTDIGKSYATGLIARYLMSKQVKVITQKLVQTGQDGGISQDILVHRQLMGIEPTEWDQLGMTCRQIFKYPASPHLAAAMEGSVVDCDVATEATEDLQKMFQVVLLEGAGGLHVPLSLDRLTADYLETMKYPLILVSSGKLGSINHTLLSLEAAATRGIPLAGIVYNNHVPADGLILRDTLDVLGHYLAKYGRPGALVEMPKVGEGGALIDFGPLFEGFEL